MREGPTAVETSSTANEFDVRNNNSIFFLSSTPTFQAATKYGGEVLCNTVEQAHKVKPLF